MLLAVPVVTRDSLLGFLVTLESVVEPVGSEVIPGSMAGSSVMTHGSLFESVMISGSMTELVMAHGSLVESMVFPDSMVEPVMAHDSLVGSVLTHDLVVAHRVSSTSLPQEVILSVGTLHATSRSLVSSRKTPTSLTESVEIHSSSFGLPMVPTLLVALEVAHLASEVAHLAYEVVHFASEAALTSVPLQNQRRPCRMMRERHFHPCRLRPLKKSSRMNPREWVSRRGCRGDVCRRDKDWRRGRCSKQVCLICRRYQDWNEGRHSYQVSLKESFVLPWRLHSGLPDFSSFYAAGKVPKTTWLQRTSTSVVLSPVLRFPFSASDNLCKIVLEFPKRSGYRTLKQRK